MIKTVVYVHSNGFCGCHSVGVLGCIEIQEEPCLGFDGTPSYQYFAIYDDGDRYEIDDVLLATDILLA